MLTFFAGLISGVLISIPVGPVNISLLTTTLRLGFARAIFIGMGGALMDLLYMYLAVSGVSLLRLNPVVLNVFYTVGISLLILLGLYELFSSEKKTRQALATREEATAEGKPGTRRKLFALGVAFYVTNPGFLAFFAGLAVWLKASGFFQPGPVEKVLLALGVGLGSLSWFVFLSKMVERFRDRFSHTLLVRVNQVAGLLLVGLGLALGLR